MNPVYVVEKLSLKKEDLVRKYKNQNSRMGVVFNEDE